MRLLAGRAPGSPDALAGEHAPDEGAAGAAPPRDDSPQHAEPITFHGAAMMVHFRSPSEAH
eukprot:4912380-Pyramimonas_sp.AAC.1